MPIQDLVYRLIKASPLSALEMDTNLRKLANGFNALEALYLSVFNPDGSLRASAVVAGESTNGTDDYAFSSANISAQDQLLNKLIILGVDVANVGTATLNISGLGPHPISHGVRLETGVLQAGGVALLRWNGTVYQLIASSSAAGSNIGGVNFGLDTGTLDDQFVIGSSGTTVMPATFTAGYQISFVAAVRTSGGATPTCKVGAITSNVKKYYGGAIRDLRRNDIVPGQLVVLEHDGTQFQLISAHEEFDVRSQRFDLPTPMANFTVTHTHNQGYPLQSNWFLECISPIYGIGNLDRLHVSALKTSNSFGAATWIDRSTTSSLYVNANGGLFIFAPDDYTQKPVLAANFQIRSRLVFNKPGSAEPV